MKAPPLRVPLLFLAGFLVTAVGVWYVPGVAAWDAQAFRAVNGQDLGPAFNQLMYGISAYGREYLWVAVTFVMVALGDKRTKAVGLGLALLFIVGIVAGDLAKELAFRTRPDEALSGVNLRVPLETDSSFPSGHALIVSIGGVYSLLTLKRKWLSGLLAVEAALVSFSRVYVGVHYPLDVFAGFFLGGLIATGGLRVGLKYFRPWVERAASYACKVLRDGPFRL